MKSEDFKELQEFCERKGYQILNESLEDNTKFFVVSKKKDEWEGVEFAQLKDGSKSIYKINSLGDFERTMCKPSTEQAYIDQLKAKAFELYGDIKEGDRFDRTAINIGWGHNVAMEKDPFNRFFWKYDKSNDTFFIGKYGIYQKGKWAKKIEKVRVDYKSSKSLIQAIEKAVERDLEDFKINLSKFLQEYLNSDQK